MRLIPCSLLATCAESVMLPLLIASVLVSVALATDAPYQAPRYSYQPAYPAQPAYPQPTYHPTPTYRPTTSYAPAPTYHPAPSYQPASYGYRSYTDRDLEMAELFSQRK